VPPGSRELRGRHAWLLDAGRCLLDLYARAAQVV
jgi:hypothetical protein